jgi:ABC-2 type transport system permease protein
MTNVAAVARKYWVIFSIAVVDRFTYRTDFLFGTLMRFMPIVTTIFLWSAIFEASSRNEIAGLTRDGVVAYYLLTMVGRAFSSMPGLAGGIASDVRTGQLKKYLTQPVSLIGYLLASRAAHKLVYYGIAVGPFALVFWLCRDYFPGWPSTTVMVCFVVSLLLAFVIGFAFEALIGMTSFWLLEISSFNYIFITLIYVLSGHMFPLDLAPEPWATVLKSTPFQYLAYFPAMLFLRGDQMPASEVIRATAVEFLVAAGLLTIVYWVYRAGLRQYSAYGG